MFCRSHQSELSGRMRYKEILGILALLEEILWNRTLWVGSTPEFCSSSRAYWSCSCHGAEGFPSRALQECIQVTTCQSPRSTRAPRWLLELGSTLTECRNSHTHNLCELSQSQRSWVGSRSCYISRSYSTNMMFSGLMSLWVIFLNFRKLRPSKVYCASCLIMHRVRPW